MSNTTDRDEALETLSQLIHDIPVVMLTTRCPDGSLHSRPMVNVNREFSGQLWFFTHDDDPKVVELQAEPHVNVALASPADHWYVSISGTASLDKDRERMKNLWNADCQPWFADGLDDPRLALIRVDVERTEHWDAKTKAMIAISGLLQKMTGGRPREATKHEKLDWHVAPAPRQ